MTQPCACAGKMPVTDELEEQSMSAALAQMAVGAGKPMTEAQILRNQQQLVSRRPSHYLASWGSQQGGLHCRALQACMGLHCRALQGTSSCCSSSWCAKAEKEVGSCPWYGLNLEAVVAWGLYCGMLQALYEASGPN